jgi:hypothetical protein
LVASVGHHLDCRLRVSLAAVGEQDVLADAYTARDSLTDLSSADDHDDVFLARDIGI